MKNTVRLIAAAGLISAIAATGFCAAANASVASDGGQSCTTHRNSISCFAASQPAMATSPRPQDDPPGREHGKPTYW
ncbi:MAG TPA: hypothetical protein VGM75_16270 [Pseudonocardiaceae bacterium]